ncbi:hypothetical protein I4U23_001481 [Adineta vaga]|nr:hypothetical protein I4U23_001481 [Adineta vaga]
MIKLIIGQWLTSFLVILYALIWHYFEYLPENYHCQIAFTNFQGLIIILLIVYFGPTIASKIIYVYIIYHTKHQINVTTQQIRYRAMQRDLIVLRRVIIIITTVLLLSLPTLILWIYYIVTGYLHPLSYHLEWVLFSISLVFLSIASAIITSQIRQLILLKWKHNQRVQPMIMNNVPEIIQRWQR